MEIKPIECPKGVIKLKAKNRKYTSVYVTTEKVYNKEKKYNVNKRKCIGKMVDDMHMLPNDAFYEFYPELRPLEEPTKKSGSIRIGIFIIIFYILQKLELNEILDTVYSDKSNIIKDLSTYLIVSEDNVMQHFPDYEYNHPQFHDSTVSDSYVSELLKDMPISQHEYFLELWNQKQPHNEKIYIDVDSTNSSTSSRGIELAEIGHAKIDIGLPIVNTALAISSTTGRPLFYEDYPGSIIDNTQFSDMVERAIMYGYTNIGFILDRGYFSKENIKFLEEHGYSFIMMAKGNALFIRDSIDEARAIFETNSSYYIAEKNLYGITIKRKLYSDDSRERYIHVFWDKKRASEEECRLLNMLTAAECDINKMINLKKIDKNILKKMEEFFNIEYNEEKDQIISYSRNEENIKKHLNRCGCFAIITSDEMTAKDALYRYRHRDSIEKIFGVSKSFLGEDTFRVHNTESLHSKQQILFLSEILRNEIFNGLSELKEKDKKSFTVPSAIREMEKIEILQNSNGKYRLRFNLTKKQKEILNCFGIDEISFKKITQDICNKYSEQIL